MDERYYREHLGFLLEGGRRLAEAFPRAAERLAGRGLDPDVERLLEGIAYLAGNIEEKHDRSVPEVCQLVLDILFPHYLSPLPPSAIVQLDGSRPASIPRGTELESQPVNGTPCRLRTAYDVEVGQLSLNDVVWQPGSRQSRLLLKLQRRPDQPLPDRLRLHLHGEPLLTRSLLSWLQTRLERIEILDGNGQVLAGPQGLRLQPLGFGEDEALFPYPDGSFEGFRLVQEYFALPQKFLFVDLLGWQQALAGRTIPEQLTVRFDLRVEAARAVSVGAHNIRLGCTPVVNVFEHSADPMQRQPGRLEYMVRPAGPHGHYAVYRVTGVSGFGPGSGAGGPGVGSVEYPLLSELDLQSDGHGFCQLHRRERDGEVLVFLSVSDGERPLPERQALLVDLLCTNGALPLALRTGDVCRAPGLPEARLLTPPTRSVSVEVGAALPARLATHLALGQRDLTTVEAMRDLLTLYNFPAIHDTQAARAHRLLREGLLESVSRLTQHNYHRVPIWGRATQLTLEETAFDTQGEIYLFGSVLNEVIALQSPINTFSELTVRGARSQETFRWPRRLGRLQLDRS